MHIYLLAHVKILYFSNLEIECILIIYIYCRLVSDESLNFLNVSDIYNFYIVYQLWVFTYVKLMSLTKLNKKLLTYLFTWLTYSYKPMTLPLHHRAS